MKNKYYGLTQQPNAGVKDEAPEWMNCLFENKEAKIKENPFKDSSNFLINSTNTKKVNKCNICGSILDINEVGFCSKCL